MNQPILRPAAAADVEAGYLWYEAQRSGLGEEFLEEFAATMELIADAPEAFAVLHRNTRRALLRRFPFGVFYRIMDDSVVVVACMQGNREPRRWQERE